MLESRPFWYLLDPSAWVVLVISIVNAFIIKQPWVVLPGVIVYLVAFTVDLTGGRALGRTVAIRLVQVEQKNRELHAEQSRLLGVIRERDEKLAKESSQPK